MGLSNSQPQVCGKWSLLWHWTKRKLLYALGFPIYMHVHSHAQGDTFTHTKESRCAPELLCDFLCSLSRDSSQTHEKQVCFPVSFQDHLALHNACPITVFICFQLYSKIHSLGFPTCVWGRNTSVSDRWSPILPSNKTKRQTLQLSGMMHQSEILTKESCKTEKDWRNKPLHCGYFHVDAS